MMDAEHPVIVMVDPRQRNQGNFAFPGPPFRPASGHREDAVSDGRRYHREARDMSEDEEST